MPDPYTDEQAIVDGITGPSGRTIEDLYQELILISSDIAILRARANEGQLPPAARLANEFLLRSDQDGGKGPGGSVYGVDFQIDPEDPGFPPALEAVHNHPRWPSDNPPPSITWAAYLALYNP